MKAQTSFVPNKKLILHFDVNSLLTLPTRTPDLFVLVHLSRSMNFALVGFGVNCKKMLKMILIR